MYFFCSTATQGWTLTMDHYSEYQSIIMCILCNINVYNMYIYLAAQRIHLIRVFNQMNYYYIILLHEIKR